MKLVLLGSTGYHPNDLRQTACLMIPQMGLVLDAGTGMYRVRDYLATCELDIFLSHAHLDHIVGLTYLIGALQEKSVNRITIHGEEAKLQAVQDHLFSELLFPVRPAYEFRTLEARVDLPQAGRLVHFPLKHPGGSVGYRLEWPGHSLAYVTDTVAEQGAAYIEAIRGVDLLVHECNFGDEHRELAEKTGHSHTSAVAQVAREAGVGRMVLVHLDPSVSQVDPIGLDVARRVFPATQLGTDLLELDF